MGNSSRKDFCTYTLPATTWLNWMSSIPDGKSLADLSIPGTNNSMCFYGLSRCQSWPLTKQFEAGIRFVDIRCRHINDDLLIQNGEIKLTGYLKGVLAEALAFLEEYPTESILLYIRDEYTPTQDIENFKKRVGEIITDIGTDWFWQNSSIPTLGQARGKIIIIPNDFSPAWGISDSVLDIHEKDEVPTLFAVLVKWPSLECRLQAVQEKENGEKLYLTFSSGCSRFALNESVATWINSYLHDYLESQESEKTRLGVVIMDFPGADLVHLIIRCNKGSTSQTFLRERPPDAHHPPCPYSTPIESCQNDDISSGVHYPPRSHSTPVEAGQNNERGSSHVMIEDEPENVPEHDTPDVVHCRTTEPTVHTCEDILPELEGLNLSENSHSETIIAYVTSEQTQLEIYQGENSQYYVMENEPVDEVPTEEALNEEWTDDLHSPDVCTPSGQGIPQIFSLTLPIPEEHHPPPHPVNSQPLSPAASNEMGQVPSNQADFLKFNSKTQRLLQRCSTLAKNNYFFMAAATKNAFKLQKFQMRVMCQELSALSKSLSFKASKLCGQTELKSVTSHINSVPLGGQELLIGKPQTNDLANIDELVQQEAQLPPGTHACDLNSTLAPGKGRGRPRGGTNARGASIRGRTLKHCRIPRLPTMNLSKVKNDILL